MKTLWLYFRILIAIWPEVMQLIKHIKTMIDDGDHRIPAAKHAIAQAKRVIPDAAAHAPPKRVKVNTYRAHKSGFPSQLDELEDI